MGLLERQIMPAVFDWNEPRLGDERLHLLVELERSHRVLPPYHQQRRAANGVKIRTAVNAAR